MGQMKELFLSIQQGMMEGINIERAERERMLDDEYRLSVFKAEENSKFICGSCSEECDEYTYSEDRDVDECNDCKTINK